MLSQKIVCSHHFSEADFTSVGCTRLNRRVIPTFCASTSHSHSAPLPVEPTFSIPLVSSLLPLVACAVDACQNEGLVVVPTVCYMGANSVKAVKQLDKSEKTPFFGFNDQEIAAVFDPPHLLKCMCNLFLKHDVMNVGFEVVVNGEELNGTAKWAIILKLCEIDKQNMLYHLLRNVTDRHLNHVAQDAMKISLAGQVTSSTVAESIDTQVPADTLLEPHLSKRLMTALDSFSGVKHYPDRRKLVSCCLISTSKHMEHCRSAIDKVESWTFLNNECEPVFP